MSRVGRSGQCEIHDVSQNGTNLKLFHFLFLAFSVFYFQTEVDHG